jgi:hypothetical protein
MSKRDSIKEFSHNNNAFDHDASTSDTVDVTDNDGGTSFHRQFLRGSGLGRRNNFTVQAPNPRRAGGQSMNYHQV